MKLTLNDIQGQYASTTELNANFALIETALENTLSRDGTTPNTMSADLDMNSNDINNADTVNTVNLVLNGSSVVPSGVYTATASNITNTPTGDIVATDVQAAITELDTEKVPETDFSTFGKTLVDDATASDARTTLGLGTVATESTVPIAKGGTGETTAQAAIDTLSNVSAATNEHVLTKDTATGNAAWKVVIPTIADGSITEAKLNFTVQLTESFTSAEQTITSAGSLTIAHSLSATPTLIQCRLICKTAENNYSIGDEIILDAVSISTSVADNKAHQLTVDSTNINLRFGAAGLTYSALNKTTGAGADLTNANWKLVVRAWA